MAAKGVDIDRETFSCSICLDLLKEPVTIPCGHSYCMGCVKTHWAGEMKSYSCPQCRQNFTQRPVLVKNTLLAVLMEGLKKSGPPAAPQSPSSAEHKGVFCDMCSKKRRKAVKSCLQCLVSYCKEHLQPHHDVAALKKHKLVEPTENLQENLCSRHDEVMKMFCRTDQQCICYLCSVDQHKGHDTVTAAAERAEKHNEVRALQLSFNKRLGQKAKELEQLQLHVKNSSLSADAAVEHSDKSLKELLHLLEERMSEVKQQVRSQQEAEEHRVKELQDKVLKEIKEMRAQLFELDSIENGKDPVRFLLKFPSFSEASETSDSITSSQTPPPFQDMVSAAVSKLRSALQETSPFDSPAVVHKPKVNTPKTDDPPAGAHGTAAPQQTSQREGHAETLPLQSLQPQPIQGDIPPPQKSEDTNMLAFAAAVRQLKLNTGDNTEGIQLNPPSVDFSSDEWRDYFVQTFKVYPVYYVPMCSRAGSLQQPPPPSQDTDEWPELAHHNLKQPSPSPSQSSTDANYLKKYTRKISWDPRSLNDKLKLCNENLSVTRMAQSQNHRLHVFRFTELPQVVSKETLTGLCYFEVEVHTHPFKPVTLAVAYKDIKRDGSSSECSFGMNSKSWAFEIFRDHSVICHNARRNVISIGKGVLIGVFVDYKAGILSFYRDMNHAYTFNVTFTQPLVAGIRLDNPGDAGSFCRRMLLDKSK